MQDNKVVELKTGPRGRGAPQVNDFWFAQVEARLSRIETLIRRLEWHLWTVVCGAGALLMIEVLRVLAPGRL